jgi:hypothetical protein
MATPPDGTPAAMAIVIERQQQESVEGTLEPQGASTRPWSGEARVI